MREFAFQTVRLVLFADLQMVNITVRVLLKPKVEQLPRIYSRLGVDFDENVMPSIGNEVLKSAVVRPVFHSGIVNFLVGTI